MQMASCICYDNDDNEEEEKKDDKIGKSFANLSVYVYRCVYMCVWASARRGYVPVYL